MHGRYTAPQHPLNAEFMAQKTGQFIQFRQPEKFNAVAISLGVNEVTCGRRVRKAQDQQAEWFAQTGFAEAQSVCLRKFRRYAPDILSLA
jgi:hypothetical protein